MSAGEKIIVCGGRDFADRALLELALDRQIRERGISELHHGDARGADRLAGKYARRNGIPEVKHPADWSRDGRAAGFRRNTRMLEQVRPDRVIAMPGGSGTEHMVKLARRAGVPVTRA